jgi:hypothetical protein
VIIGGKFFSESRNPCEPEVIELFKKLAGAVAVETGGFMVRTGFILTSDHEISG